MPGLNERADLSGGRKQAEEVVEDARVVLEQLLLERRQFGDWHPPRAGGIVATFHFGQSLVAEVEVIRHGHDAAASAAARVIEAGLAPQRRAHAQRQTAEAGLFLELAQRRVVEAFARLEETTGTSPQPVTDVAATLDEQHVARTGEHAIGRQ